LEKVAYSGDTLNEGLTKLGLFSSRTAALLLKYIEEIELFNPAYGLVKVKDRGELIIKHILDSLAPAEIIQGLLDRHDHKPSAADVGSGAGLPGIPLAVCMPDTEFTLIERMGRRAGFLRNTLALLGLPNVRVEEAEMEQIAARQESRFDIIVFRAYRPLDSAILKNLFRLLKPDGILAAYKGRRESVEQEMENLRAQYQGALSWELFPVEVPFLDEERRTSSGSCGLPGNPRHLLIIRQPQV
jgi:16S rRNA (guanine527-N7)-methyltransferase